jgi:hypothetical protein
MWSWDKGAMETQDEMNTACQCSKAAKSYTDELRALLDLGVDCFKVDFGEPAISRSLGATIAVTSLSWRRLCGSGYPSLFPALPSFTTASVSY